MSFKKKIYFSFIGYIISFFQNSIRFVHRPFMVYGYYNQVNKKFLRNVRISSSAYITGKKKLDISDGVWVNHYARIDASGGVKTVSYTHLDVYKRQDRRRFVTYAILVFFSEV